MFAKGILLVVLLFVAPRAEAAQSCMRATHALMLGAVPKIGDLVTVDCGVAKPVSAVRYDTGLRAVRLVRIVHQDEIVAAIPDSMMAAVIPGQKLYIVVQVGAVVVQREVEALQPANPGQELFVRAADGQVMSVLYRGGVQ